MPRPLLDLFAIETLWSDEQRLARDSVRAFSREVYAPVVRAHYEAETFPTELIDQIGG